MAVGNVSITTVANVLKTLYPQKALRKLMYKDSPLIGMIPSKEEFYENNLRLSVRFGRPAGRSAVFATAQANRGTSTDAAFLLTRARDYAVGAIDAEAMLAGNSSSALVNILKSELEGTMMTFKRSVNVSYYGNGSGARGQISAGSTVSTATITLAQPSDVVFFEVDQFLVASATNAVPNTPRAGRVQVTRVDRTNGTITVSANWNAGIAAIAVNDFLMCEGDAGILPRGLQAWVPIVAPTGGDNFFGQDRSVDNVRLAGIAYVAPGGEAKADSIINAIARLLVEGANPDVCMINPLDRSDIFRSLQSKGMYQMIPTVAKDVQVSYNGIVFEGGEKPLPLISDVNCPRGRAFILTTETWTAPSLRAIPHMVDDDGQTILRQTNSDSFEFRMRALYQIGNVAPGFNAHIQFG
jgi:hypothetical protein